MEKITITYNGIEITVNKSVADYLESERKREQAQDRSDRRHLDMRELTDSLYDRLSDKPVDVSEQLALQSETEGLLKAVTSLTEDEKTIIINRYFKGKGLTEIAEGYGVTYQAIQKRIKAILKKLRKSLS